jgi:hypothetical protein
MEYAVPKIMVAFIGSDGEEWQNEYAETPPFAGQFIWRGTRNGYKAYKVAEVWIIDEKHGAVTHGLTAFVDPVDVMQTRLGKHVPSYYGN